MKKTSARRDPATGRFTVGYTGFGKISAVEGVRLTPEMERDLHDFDRKGLSGDERRRAISRKYGKATKS